MRALIVVDVQNDFCEGGSLAVAGGNKVAEDIAAYIESGGEAYDTIVFTKDNHSADGDNGGHFSDTPDFKDSWPPHCISGTVGAAIHPALEATALHYLWFCKGYGTPSYSGFEGVAVIGMESVPLDYYLKAKGITLVHVVGIAGDYCVKATARDAVKLGYEVVIIPELVASVGGEEATDKVLSELALDKEVHGMLD